MVPVTLRTPLPLLIRYKSPPLLLMLTVLIPTNVLARFVKTNPPLTVVSVTGSVHEKLSSKERNASVSVPRSIAKPALPRVMPAPVSP